MQRLFRHLAGCVLAFGIAGCGPSSSPPISGDPPPIQHEEEGDHGHSHDHAAEGPHHGHLIELGKGEFHAELVDTAKSIAFHILDGTAKKNVPIAAGEITLNLVAEGKPVSFPLAAKPLEGEGEGKSSYFESTDEKLLAAFKTKDVKGRLNLTIDEKPYVGAIEHHAHGEHGHDH